MIAPRRMLLQLTPLLDLLLIVIFAQYMEVRERQQTETVRSQAVAMERDQLLLDLASLRDLLAELQTRSEASRSAAAQLQGELERSQSDLDRTLAQQRVLGELVVELFGIPQEEVARILQPGRFPQGTPTPEELEQLRERFRQISVQQSGRMIEHLLSYEEIRKRCDVWEMHVDAAGKVSMSAGMHRVTFAIDSSLSEQAKQQEITRRLYDWSRTLPQPKSLVVVLLTYDRKSTFGDTEPARRALQELVSKLQLESGGRIRFEYADLGFRIE